MERIAPTSLFPLPKCWYTPYATASNMTPSTTAQLMIAKASIALRRGQYVPSVDAGIQREVRHQRAQQGGAKMQGKMSDKRE